MKNDEVITHKKWSQLLASLGNYGKQSQRNMRQRYVDYIKYKVLIFTLVSHIKHMYEYYNKEGGDDGEIDWSIARSMLPGQQHLMFERKDMQAYGLYPGEAPPDANRPVWLRGIKLDISYEQLPEEVWRKCAPGGEYAAIIDDYSQMNENQIEQMFSNRQIVDKPIIVQ